MSLSVRLLRLIPAERAHTVAIWSLRTGLWRLGLIADGLVTLAWTLPVLGLLRLLQPRRRR